MREFTKSVMSYTWAMTAFGVQQTLNLFSVPRRGEQHPATEAFNNVARATSEQMDDAVRAFWRGGDNIQRGLVDLTFGVLTLGAFNPRGRDDREDRGGRDDRRGRDDWRGRVGGRDWARAAADVGQQTAEAVRQGANVMGQAAQAFGAGASSASQQTGWGPVPPPDDPDAWDGGRRS